MIFRLVFALTREPARRAGDYGRRIDAAMAADLIARLPAGPPEIFVCGSNAFVEAATQALIAAGLAPTLIRTERYGG